jgi:hypothetical protein
MVAFQILYSLLLLTRLRDAIAILICCNREFLCGEPRRIWNMNFVLSWGSEFGTWVLSLAGWSEFGTDLKENYSPWIRKVIKQKLFAVDAQPDKHHV